MEVKNENENPEIRNRDMVVEALKTEQPNCRKSATNQLLQQQNSIEFHFLEVSIVSVTLKNQLMSRPDEILCHICCENVFHEVQSCISSDQGKYFFPKQTLKYILTKLIDESLKFSFFTLTKERIGTSSFTFDTSSLAIKRMAIPIECNGVIVGEVTFLSQLQDEGYFDDSESDCASSIASRTPPSSLPHRTMPQATFSGQSPRTRRSANERPLWSNNSQLSPPLSTHSMRSYSSPTQTDVLSSSIYLLSDFNLEDDAANPSPRNSTFPINQTSSSSSSSPPSTPSSIHPSASTSASTPMTSSFPSSNHQSPTFTSHEQESDTTAPERNFETTPVANQLIFHEEEAAEEEGNEEELTQSKKLLNPNDDDDDDNDSSPTGKQQQKNIPEEIITERPRRRSGRRESMSWLTPTNIMIGICTIIFLYKSNSTVVE